MGRTGCGSSGLLRFCGVYVSRAKEEGSKGDLPGEKWREDKLSRPLLNSAWGLAPLRRAGTRDLQGHMARGTTWLRPR